MDTNKRSNMHKKRAMNALFSTWATRQREETFESTLQYVLIEGQRVSYRVAGKGDPVILVHGLSASSLWWQRNVPSLAQRYRVYLVDLPGFGTTHYPRSQFALKKAGIWLLRWMEAVELERAHFIGHSMGGYICMWIASHRPEVVERLVLVSPAVIHQRRTIFSYLVPLLISIRQLTPSFFWILLFDGLRAGPVTILRAASDLLAQDVRKDMKSVVAPTLLVWGENDLLVPPTLGVMIREQIAHAQLFLLKEAGHVSMFERPAEFNAALLAFLEGETIGE